MNQPSPPPLTGKVGIVRVEGMMAMALEDRLSSYNANAKPKFQIAPSFKTSKEEVSYFQNKWSKCIRKNYNDYFQSDSTSSDGYAAMVKSASMSLVWLAN